MFNKFNLFVFHFRYSVFYLTRYDGVLDIWDIIQAQTKPRLSVKLCDEALTAIRFHENGQLAVIGNQKGVTYLVEMSENFCQNMSHEKAFLGQVNYIKVGVSRACTKQNSFLFDYVY